MNTDILTVKDVSYMYVTKYQKIEALKEVSCSFAKGKLYAIVGHSGSGKSTLLSLLAGLDLPTSGEVLVKGKPTSALDRDRYRRECVSVVYQSFHLFPLLTALENVMYPMELCGRTKKEAQKKAKEIIRDVGLSDKIFRQFPQMMSGGEQQRVAIARSLASEGEILLADEPTGNLDTTNENMIVQLLKKLAYDKNYAVIVITHDDNVADQADIVYQMKDGKIVSKTENRGSDSC